MTIAFLVPRSAAWNHDALLRDCRAIEGLGRTIRLLSIAASDAISARQPAGLHWRALLRVAASRPGRFLATLRFAAKTLPRAGRWSLLSEACRLTGLLDGVTHLHALSGAAAAGVARLLNRLTGLPYSFAIVGPELEMPATLDLPGKIDGARAVLAASSYDRSQLLRWSRFEDWHKIGVIPPGAEDAGASDIPAADAILCCIARPGAEQGLPLLFEALALLRRRGDAFHLTLIADGMPRARIDQMVPPALADAVTVCSLRDPADRREAILAARALVLPPSNAAGLQDLIVEALATGRPVITISIGGTAELVDAACGWLLPAGSAVRLADAMAEALAADPAALQAMGEAGRRRARERHDAHRNAVALLERIGAA